MKPTNAERRLAEKTIQLLNGGCCRCGFTVASAAEHLAAVLAEQRAKPRKTKGKVKR